MEEGGHSGEEQQEEQGGLFVVNKEKHFFKAPAPKTSLLGLDKLAAAKRAEAEERGGKHSGSTARAV